MSDVRPLLSPEDVAKLLGVSRMTLWRLRTAGEFPAPMTIGKQLKRWRPEEIEAYLAKRVASSMGVVSAAALKECS